MSFQNLSPPMDVDTSNSSNSPHIDPSYLAYDTFILKEKIPDKFHFGISYQFNSYITYSLDFSHIYWRQKSESYKNYFGASGGIVTHINNQLSLSAGFMFSDRNLKQENDRYLDTNDKLNAVFLLVGANFQHQNIDLDFACATSKLYSGDWREQNIIKVALGLYL